MREDHRARDVQRVVVLGASGMLGSAVLRELAGRPGLEVLGTVRDVGALPGNFTEQLGEKLIPNVDVTDPVSRSVVIAHADVVINAVGVIKQASGLEDRVGTVDMNARLPHQLADECAGQGSRLIHVSTDCVFSGRHGGYSEEDVPDPVDFYGRSKLLGEVTAPALTLRTSIIGHELTRHASLIDWFLSQPQTEVRGYVNAIYSGVTTTEFSKLLGDVILPRPELAGVFHVASEPISKFELLSLVADAYGWNGEISPFEDFRCNRSMVASRLTQATGYLPPAWPEMVRQMFENRPDWAIGPTVEESLA